MSERLADEAFLALSQRERIEAFRNADVATRRAMHEAIAAIKVSELAQRRQLGEAFLQQHPPLVDIPWETGFAIRDAAEETRSACAESLALAHGRAAQADNRALEFPVLGRDFTVDSEAMAFVTTPAVLAPVIQYFGMVPVLFNLFVTRAHNLEVVDNSAHFFHIDPEDTLQMKVFLHLTPVDDDCGPLHALPAKFSGPILDGVCYKGIDRFTDEAIEDRCGSAQIRRFLGPPGTVIFADTTRCLHFGGRPRAPGKPLREMLLAQYLIPTSPLFPIGETRPQPMFMQHVPAGRGRLWDALFGYELV